MKIRSLLAAMAMIVAMNCFSQGPMNVSETRYDWSGLAQGITQGKTSNYDKAYAIYRWLCDNIAYDTSYSIYNSDDAYEQKRGVCQAYSELFYRLGEAVGLSVDIIGGKSKDNDGNIPDMGHAWVFVRIDGNSGILVDPTWGAGSVKNGVFKRNDNDDTWFHVDPAWMIFSHFPDDASYQLLDNQIDYSTFASLPSLMPSLKNFGFKGDELLAASRSGKKPDLPECYYNSKIKVGKIPHDGTLRVGASYDFILKPEADYEFAIINGNDYDDAWQRDNGTHKVRFVPSEAGDLMVGYRKRGTSGNHWDGLASYKVASPTSADIANLEQAAPHKSPTLKKLKNYDADRMLKRGLDASKVLAAVKRDNIKQLPLIYDAGKFTLNDVPLNGKLKAGASYRFAFSPYEDGDWVIVDGDNFLSDWTQDPQTRAWVTTITPSAPGQLMLAFKPANSADGNYSVCMTYDVE